MKIIKNTIIYFAILPLPTVLMLSFADNQQKRFYYAYDRRIPLYEVKDKLIIRFSQKMNKKSIDHIRSLINIPKL